MLSHTYMDNTRVFNGRYLKIIYVLLFCASATMATRAIPVQCHALCLLSPIFLLLYKLLASCPFLSLTLSLYHAHNCVHSFLFLVEPSHSHSLWRSRCERAHNKCIYRGHWAMRRARWIISIFFFFCTHLLELCVLSCVCGRVCPMCVCVWFALLSVSCCLAMPVAFTIYR